MRSATQEINQSLGLRRDQFGSAVPRSRGHLGGHRAVRPAPARAAPVHLFFWASLYAWLNPAWRVTIHGRDLIERDAAHLYVANHLSLLDILVLFRLFTDFKWVSKAEIFKVPGVG